MIPTKSGPTAIKMSIFQSDKQRIIDHGYDETNYRVVCLVDPGTVADFEMMKSRWQFEYNARSLKVYPKGKQICFDMFGRELTVDYESLAIEWNGKKLYLSVRGQRIAYGVA